MIRFDLLPTRHTWHKPVLAAVLLALICGIGSAQTALPEALGPQIGPDSGTLKSSVSQVVAYTYPTFHARRESFRTDFLGPGAFIAPVFQAIGDQTFPLKVSYPPDGYVAPGAHPEHGLIPEWREGFSGYTKRYASRFGMGLTGTSVRYGLGELLHQDVSYHPCTCTRTLPRAFHAITQAYIARTTSGRSVPSLAAFVSPFVAAEIATAAWYPARYNVSDALRTSVSLYFSLPIKNLIQEKESH